MLTEGSSPALQVICVLRGNELASATPAHFPSSFQEEMSWGGLPPSLPQLISSGNELGGIAPLSTPGGFSENHPKPSKNI